MARKLKAVNEAPAGSVPLPGGDDIDFGVTAPAGDAPADDGEVVADPPIDEKPKGRRRAQTKPEAGFMGEAAEADRSHAKAKHVDDGMKGVAEMVQRMVRGLAYVKNVTDLQVKLAVLSEIADTAANVTDDARRAVRSAQAENRNLQQ